MKPTLVRALMAASLLALGCGGDDDPTGPGGGGGNNGATITQVSNGSSFGGETTEYSINFVGAVSPGAFDLGAGAGRWQCQIQRIGTAESWSVGTSDSVGSIIFATVLPGRMQGIFFGTFPPLNAPDSLAVTDGFFSVYLP